MKNRILLIDDEILKLMTLSDTLLERGYEVETCESGKEALERFENSTFDIIIVDLKLPDISGLDLLKEFKQKEPDTAVVMMTAYGTIDVAVEAMRLGAHDFVAKPFLNDELLMKIERVLSYKELKNKASLLERELLGQKELRELVGSSSSMQRVGELIQIVGPTDSTVLICGESGTGKQLAADAVHRISLFREGPFVNISCGTLAPNLLESELFGHEKGAFTGANARKIGRFELAQNGTIFLDDVDDIDISLQVKLLRVLQDKEFERVGGTKTIQANVRVISATKKDLHQCVESGTFRRDLYYRLNVFPIVLPPLRERLEDIPELVNHFLLRWGRKKGQDGPRITKEALSKLMQHSWPGNVRELENIIERTLVVSSSNVIDIDSLDFFEAAHESLTWRGLGEIVERASMSYRESMSSFEKELISTVLRKAAGNKSHAAALLRIPRTTLVDRIRKLGLE